MSIDFSLTPDQQKLQSVARAFAEDVLKPVVQEADLEPDPQKAFQMMKEPYKKIGLLPGTTRSKVSPTGKRGDCHCGNEKGEGRTPSEAVADVTHKHTA
jgi:hypothetical protein